MTGAGAKTRPLSTPKRCPGSSASIARIRGFSRLAPTTRRGYQQCLDIIDGWSKRRKHPGLASLQRKDIAAFHRELSETPAQANAVIRVLRLLLHFAVDEGFLNENPASKPRLRSSKPRQLVWSDDDLGVFKRTAERLGRPSMALAVLLGASLGQRQGDILRLTWSQYDGTKISLRQGKTGVILSVPATAELRAALDAAPAISASLIRQPSDTILISEATRQPYKPDFFRHEFRRIATAAQLDKLQYLDLRRTAVVRLAEAGCTTAEIAAITGHQIDRTARILETYLPRTGPMADAAIRKLELHKTNKSRLQEPESELDG